MCTKILPYLAINKHLRDWTGDEFGVLRGWLVQPTPMILARSSTSRIGKARINTCANAWEPAGINHGHGHSIHGHQISECRTAHGRFHATGQKNEALLEARVIVAV